MPLTACLLLISGLLILYIVAGYPLLLALRVGSAKGRPAKDPGFTATVSVVMAVHNGAKLLRRKIEVLLELDYPHELMDIIVISDGSTDETAEIAREFESKGVRITGWRRPPEKSFSLQTFASRSSRTACATWLLISPIRRWER
jgi:cellulose synthase/poly-beta-1,6-N-acetylglucosamine synthase-like glycosyltransferase